MSKERTPVGEGMGGGATPPLPRGNILLAARSRAAEVCGLRVPHKMQMQREHVGEEGRGGGCRDSKRR